MRLPSIAIFVAAIFFAMSSISCSPEAQPLSEVGEKLVGDWQHTHAVAQNTVSWFRFERDGAYAMASWTDLDDGTAAAMRKKIAEKPDYDHPLKLEGNRAHFTGQKGKWSLEGDILTLKYTSHNGKDFVDTYQVLKCDDTALEMESSKFKAAGIDAMMRFRRQPLPHIP